MNARLDRLQSQAESGEVAAGAAEVWAPDLSAERPHEEALGLALKVQGLTKGFGGPPVVEGLTLALRYGEVVGLLGPNGAGKTTTLRMLAGLYAPDAGEGEVAGEPLRAGRLPAAALREKVGLVTESPGFYPRLTALENLLHFAALYGEGSGRAGEAAAGRALLLLERLGLTAHAGKRFSALSRGMKQKLAIARALIHEPPVLLLDEPSVGLDPESLSVLREILSEQAKAGRAVLLCTHLLDEVERSCDRALFLATRVVGHHQIRGQGRSVALRFSKGSVPLTEALLTRFAALKGCASCQRLPGEGPSFALTLERGATQDDVVPRVVEACVSWGLKLRELSDTNSLLELAYLNELERARHSGLLGQKEPEG